MNKVYEFWFNPFIWESAAACVSLHRTKKGAEMALAFHKEKERKEHEKDGIIGTFDDMKAWGISEREILE